VVAAGSTHTLGLRADGNVIATGNNTDGQCDVEAACCEPPFIRCSMSSTTRLSPTTSGCLTTSQAAHQRAPRTQSARRRRSLPVP
jgi:alpha-tubulin suppressor-like RCC1 family protein